MDYRKMAELTKNSAEVRRMAKSLLETSNGQLKENANRFLTDLLSFDGSKPLTTRDQEFLHRLMSRSKNRRNSFGGYRAYILLMEIWALRLEYPEDEEAEEFLQKMIEIGPEVSLTDGQWHYLLHLARRFDHIHHWVAA